MTVLDLRRFLSVLPNSAVVFGYMDDEMFIKELSQVSYKVKEDEGGELKEQIILIFD